MPPKAKRVATKTVTKIKKTKDLGPEVSRATRRATGLLWPAVATKNSEGESYVKKPDSTVDTNMLVHEAAFSLITKSIYLRVSQAYDGVGHTFALVLKPESDELIVYDHMGDKLYKDQTFWQYNMFLDELAKKLDVELNFQERLPAAWSDKEYRRCYKSGDGACVYYIDKYIINREL